LGKEYRLPEGLRPKLAAPLGRLFPGREVGGREFMELVTGAKLVVTVGDKVTETFGKLGRVPDVQVVDSKENRKGREPPEVPYVHLIKVANPAGTLSTEAIQGVVSALGGSKPARVLVEGEEDLTAVPVIAYAPDSSVVFYGQPGEGIVAVTVDAASRKKSKAILEEMEVPGPA
jgi:GTP-dependent dephospho-CoA kinase